MYLMVKPTGAECSIREHTTSCPLGRWANNDRGSLMSSGYLSRYGVQNRWAGDCSYIDHTMRANMYWDYLLNPLDWWGEESPEFY